MDTFGKRLQALRKKRNISQEQMAELMGKSRSVIISRWENDRNEPSLTEVRRLADILGTTASYLVDGVDDQVAALQDKLNEANALLVQYQKKELEQKEKEIKELKHH